MNARAGFLDPWEVVRVKLPGYSVIRLIDTDAGTQAFQIVRAEKNDAELKDLLLDGCTLITPAPATDAERAAIIAEYDNVWRAQHT